MSDEEFEIQVEAELGSTPLQMLSAELHEIYTELKEVGFPDAMTAQIIANMLTGAIGYAPDFEHDEDDEDDELEDDDFDDGDPE